MQRGGFASLHDKAVDQGGLAGYHGTAGGRGTGCRGVLRRPMVEAHRESSRSGRPHGRRERIARIVAALACGGCFLRLRFTVTRSGDPLTRVTTTFIAQPASVPEIPDIPVADRHIAPDEAT